MRLLSLIPARYLAKYLPEILAFILTKVLTWLFKKYPEKSDKVMETCKEITVALSDAIKAGEDGKITPEEIEKQKILWRNVFD